MQAFVSQTADADRAFLSAWWRWIIFLCHASAFPRKTVRPSLAVRWLALHWTSEGCSDVPSRSSSQEVEPWQIIGVAFVAIDVAKLRNAVAIADAGREGEVRFFGEVEASDEGMRRVVQRISAKFDRVHFCYEAGPTGYGLIA